MQQSLDDRIRRIEKRVDHLEHIAGLKSKQQTTNVEDISEFNSGKTAKLAAHFDQLGYKIISVNGNTDDKYHLARHIWQAYDVLNPLLEAFRKAKEQIDFECEESKCQKMTTFCAILREREWIDYEYQKKAGVLKITKRKAPDAEHFLKGGWAELCALYLLRLALSKVKMEHKIFRNLKLESKADKTKMELDIILETAHSYYIFEIKSGRNLSIGNWVDRTKIFGIKPHRYILCTTNSQIDPMMFAPYRLFTFSRLEDAFKRMLTQKTKDDADDADKTNIIALSKVKDSPL